MSELTPCNFCTYRDLRREAKKKREKLRLVPDDGWQRVQRAPIGSDDWKDGGHLFKAIGNHCEC